MSIKRYAVSNNGYTKNKHYNKHIPDIIEV
jgi:hypothetical protein